MVKKGITGMSFWVLLEIVKKCAMVLEYDFEDKKDS